MARSILNFSKKFLKFPYVIKRDFQISSSKRIALQYSPNAYFDKHITYRLMKINTPPCKIQLVYIWIDGTGENLRNIDNCINFLPKTIEEIGNIEIDGSACYLAPCDDADIILKPIQWYDDPFRLRGFNKMLLCETYKPTGEHTELNFRRCLVEALDCVVEYDVQFGFEQDLTMFDMNKRPYGWPYSEGFPAPEGHYYGGVGGDRAMAREIIEITARSSLYAGVDFKGTMAGEYPGKWTIQVGHNDQINPADDMWMARYLLTRIAEEFGVVICLDPKPIDSDEWTTNHLLVGFSTLCTRQDEGIKEIENAISKLCKNHLRHMQIYDPQCGRDLKRRDKEKYNEFSSGTSDREASISIPRTTAIEKKGFLLDRRPSSNADPYQVCNALIRTILLDE